MSSDKLPVLGYWDIRGLAEPIRYLLRYAGVEFTDKRYQFKDSHVWKDEDKHRLGLDFPNLPYWLDGEVKLSQSWAILKYLARKYDLVATDDPLRAQQELVEHQLEDLRTDFFGTVVMADDPLAVRDSYTADHLEPKLSQLSDYLADNQWLTGPRIAYVDFIAYETLDWLRLYTGADAAATIDDKYPKLRDYMKRFESLDAIKAHRSSPDYKSWPLFGPQAKWGVIIPTMSSPKPTLGYYKIRGLAQPIRLLLKYSSVDFTDKYYEFGSTDSVESMREHWLKDKYRLGLDFPNVPYYLDGQHNIKLTQSTAILRYLARKHGLVATSECALTRQDMAEYQLADIKNGFFQSLFNNKDFENSRQSYANDQLSKQLEELSKFLGQHDWLAGKQLTYVDFLAYELLDWLRLFSTETVHKFPVLVQYLTRFENLPAIKAYMSSPDYISWPLFGPLTPWGYKK
ncbi:uncharacterized protein LOC128957124 [Oppia nitens]|uniref:uncharacterized protein LOC128957124 n=1 Tax=Oppia nitens TaxID=1686743 RepID=UPI0023DCB93A|nr:uncharacterized protein LOC128957124 [Oppia nitens]